MHNEAFSPGEYANAMSEVVENLIVKAGKDLPDESRIPGDIIKEWKKYTIQYFKISPNIYLIENQFYNDLTENMKIQLMRDNLFKQTNQHESMLLQTFYKNFEIFFRDEEFGFQADDKLVCQIIASLCYITDQPNKSIVPQNVISRAIYFIVEGQVQIYYKDCLDPLVILKQGSYFGDISYLYQSFNQYYFESLKDDNG